MSYLGSNCRIGWKSYFVNVYPGHPYYEIVDQMVKSNPGKLIEVWEEKEDGRYRFWADFDGTDRAKLSVGKKRHLIVKAE